MKRLICGSFFPVFILLWSSHVAYAIPINGLVAYWQANGDATDAAAGHDGTLKNGAGFGTGQFGQAFSFNGDNEVVSIAHNVALQPTSITVAAWIKTSSLGSLLIVDKSHGFIDSTGWALQMIPGGQAAFAYGNNAGFPELLSTSALSDGRFHHIAASLDGPDGTMRLYVDGVQESFLAYTGTPTGNTRPVHIGAAFGGDLTFTNYVREFPGEIDEVAIYNRVLSVDEIADLKDNPFPVPEPVSLTLLSTGLGMIGLAGWRRRRKTQSKPLTTHINHRCT